MTASPFPDFDGDFPAVTGTSRLRCRESLAWWRLEFHTTSPSAAMPSRSFLTIRRIVVPTSNLLRRYAFEHGLCLWAWCLMTNHIHLLAVPEDRRITCAGARSCAPGLCQLLQCPIGEVGASLAGALLLLPGGRRECLAGDGVHRAQSRARGIGGPSRRLSLVQRRSTPGGSRRERISGYRFLAGEIHQRTLAGGTSHRRGRRGAPRTNPPSHAYRAAIRFPGVYRRTGVGHRTSAPAAPSRPQEIGERGDCHHISGFRTI